MAASSGAQSSSGAPLTLAQQYEQEEDCAISFELAVKVTGALVCATIKKPDHHDGPRRAIQPAHLPLMDELTSRSKPGTLTVTHLVDVCLNVDDMFDRVAVLGLMQNHEYLQLPGVLSPKAVIAFNFHMNLCILPAENNKVEVFKHFVFDGKPPLEVARRVCQGDAILVNFGANKRVGPLAFIYLFQRMGGFQVTYHTFKTKSGKRCDNLETPQQISDGYDFIEKNKHFFTKRGCKMRRWVDTETQREESPIFGWNVGRVLAAIKDLKDADAQAAPEEEYPLFWCHIQPWLQPILEQHMDKWDEDAQLWLGIGGSGKSSVQYIVGFAMARYRIFELDLVSATAGVRSSTDFDHFREDAGQPHISTMFDDGDLDRMPPRKIKAFFDKKKKSQMTTERYSSTKFDGKEHRSAGDNKVDLAAEPHITLDGQRYPQSAGFGYTGISYEVFSKMIRPAFHVEMSQPDIDAVLRRVQVYVNTEKSFYVRPAGVGDEVKIERYELKTPKLITDEALKILKRWKKTGELIPLATRTQMEAEESELFKRKLWSGSGSASSAAAAGASVKQEIPSPPPPQRRRAFARSLSGQSAENAEIDLNDISSPSGQSKKMRAGDDADAAASYASQNQGGDDIVD
ncbi:unnamed protein product [Prorocentrum cordatum]|uniref:Uncharacterized protein n=1 Tax=Prorocentrum cordatum TaxID=2364126 RepID=A0ABN9WJM0_9DINO|nr:unnamed protein product [Polarella glacialis]